MGRDPRFCTLILCFNLTPPGKVGVPYYMGPWLTSKVSSYGPPRDESCGRVLRGVQPSVGLGVRKH